jgi:protein ImuA
MQQTVPPPTPPSGRLQRISRPEPGPSACPRNGLRSVGPRRSGPNRNGESLIAVPGGGALEGSKAGVLAELRHRITALERGPSLIASSFSPELAAQSPGAWTLGAAELDQRLGSGLDAASLHEVKAEPQATGVAAGNWAAALGFALRLAVRRLQSLDASSAGAPRILWCWPSVFARELGVPHGHGFAALGLEPSSWLFAETARAADALWAMEEGLRSQSLALVIGVLGEAELTPARRLSLAAAEHLTPCLLITDPRLSPAGSTATRWRVGARGSASHPFDGAAPGSPRYAVALERCRHRPLTREPLPHLLEWSDETHRFRMAASMADRADGPRAAIAGSR